MSNFFIIVLILISAFFIVRWTQADKPKTARQRINERQRKRVRNRNTSKIPVNKTKNLKSESLFFVVKKEFSEFKIFEKHGQVLICDIKNVRKEPDEIVFIRIEADNFKKLEVKGRFMVATYPRVPTGKEMRKDFEPVLFRYK
ncbi:MAG: hypothetical protein E7D55_10755 [Acinetobacter junii]|nr:hypothetical protein [Acinetobacter junii]